MNLALEKGERVTTGGIDLEKVGVHWAAMTTPSIHYNTNHGR